MERVIAMLVRRDISFLGSPARELFYQVAVTVVSLRRCVFIMNSIFLGAVGEADNKSIMPCCGF